MQGKVHVYTGDGKGKTTAALGLSIRAAGAGFRVFFAQFIKSDEYSEIKALKRFSDLITVEQFGLGGFIGGSPSSGDIDAAQKGVARVKEIISSDKYDVVVLDEANIAVKYKLISEQDLLDIINTKSKNIELVITGRDAAAKIIERADLVTRMNAVKHYFQNGVEARVGIEK
ncbi:MAG: cob(I)yrinic acid a,c-diamide adenosyltransferase [Desulfobacterales bacterium]|jgi:cob(I)alamin adenosyltransferase